jgi:predicted nucleotide-binding protein
MTNTQGDGTSVPGYPAISPGVALKRLERLVTESPRARAAGPRTAAFEKWVENVLFVLGQFYGEDSDPFKDFGSIWSRKQSFSSIFDEALKFLRDRINELRTTCELRKTPAQAKQASGIHTSTLEPTSRKVFVVHGTDHGQKETIARFLEKLQLEPIILHEQPDHGKTIIEKFESHSQDVRCAVVLLTADDIGGPRSDPVPKELRARQNVIFELGFFIGKLNRHRTIALLGSGVALPSDYQGIIYIKLDNPDWRFLLVRELRAAGLTVDANRAL